MPQGPKVREVLRRLSKDGWVLVDQQGNHRQFKHPTKPGKVTLAGHESEHLDIGTWRSVQVQAGWRAG